MADFRAALAKFLKRYGEERKTSKLAEAHPLKRRLQNWSAWLPKKYKVILDPDSKEMFSGHVRFLKRDSPDAAHRLVLSYKKSIARIADNPFQFPIADELDILGIPPNTYRKCLFGGRYKALFRLEGEEAFIIAVVDSRAENRNALGKE
jgi:plasmid stabilization system protein ParE